MAGSQDWLDNLDTMMLVHLRSGREECPGLLRKADRCVDYVQRRWSMKRIMIRSAALSKPCCDSTLSQYLASSLGELEQTQDRITRLFAWLLPQLHVAINVAIDVPDNGRIEVYHVTTEINHLVSN